MRALTLTQPWAGLVASGIKLVENRSRSIIKREDFGKPFAIHASREIDEHVYRRIREIAPDLHLDEELTEEQLPAWYRLSRITSAVISVGTIDTVVGVGGAGIYSPLSNHLPRDQGRWYFGPIGYVLRDVRALATPVPCRGSLGFWTLPPGVELAVAVQINEQGAAP